MSNINDHTASNVPGSHEETGSSSQETPQLELHPYMALPLRAKSRKPPTTGETLYTAEEISQKIHENIRNHPGMTLESAVLQLMQDYAIDPRAYPVIAKNEPNPYTSFTYSELVPYFNIPAIRPHETIPLYRCRLPLEIIRRTVEEADYASLMHGPLREHRSEETRSRYITMLFKLIVSVFQGCLQDRPDRMMDGQVNKGEKLEHLFFAFSRTVMIFVDVKRTMSISAPEQAIAHIITECDAWDISNAGKGFWCPMLGVLTDGMTMQLFVYDSSTREIQASPPTEMLSALDTGIQSLRSIRRFVEILFDLLLVAYINGLYSFLHDSGTDDNIPGQRAGWFMALERAKCALAGGREATDLMIAGKYDEAEEIASAAWENVKKSTNLAPIEFMQGRPMSDMWEHHEMQEC